MYVALMPPSLPDMRSRVVGVSTYGRHVRCSATTARGTSGRRGPLRSWVRTAFGTTVSGLPTTFWWLWAGTLVNRAGAFVLPFLAFYLTDELDLDAAFVGLVLGALRPGQRGREPGRRRARRPAGPAPGPARPRSAPPRRWSLLGSRSTTRCLRRRVLAALLGLTSNATAAGVLGDDDRHRRRRRTGCARSRCNYWAINLGFAIAPVLGGLLAASGYLTLFLRRRRDDPGRSALSSSSRCRSPTRRCDGRRTRSTAAAARLDADVLRDRVFLALVLLTFRFAVVFMQHLSTLPVQMGDDGLSPAQYGVGDRPQRTAHRARSPCR